MYIKRKIKLKKPNKYYPFSVWITTIIIIAPVLTFFYWTVTDEMTRTDSFQFAFIAILYALTFSIPTFVISYFAFMAITRRQIKYSLCKIFLIIINIVCATITFYVCLGLTEGNIGIYGVYFLSIVISNLLFKIYKREEIISN